MEATRVDVKFFVDATSRVEPREIVPVFHGLIQRSLIKDELVIDVADYTHAADGPGVMLIGHEGQYGFETSKGRTGLLYSQRRARVLDLRSALLYGLVHALRVCSLLEREDALKGRLKWNGQEVMVRINDRLCAPNTAETWTAVEPIAREVLGKLFGPQQQVEPAPPGLELFTLHARGTAPASVETLLSRLEQ